MAADVEKLIGGYASNTLTDEERRQLFEAAMHDQALFDLLADEEALRDALRDPQSRRRLLVALSRKSTRSWLAAIGDWCRRPAHLAWVGGVASVVLAVTIGTRLYLGGTRLQERSAVSERAEPASKTHGETADHARDSITAPTSPAAPPTLPESKKDAEANAPAQQDTRQEPTAANKMTSSTDRARASGVPPPGEPLKEEVQGRPSRELQHSDSAQSAPASELPRASPPAPAPGVSPSSVSPSARALFYGAPLPGTLAKTERADQPRKQLRPAHGAPPALGLRYTVLLTQEDGNVVEVAPGRAVTLGDQVQFAVETNDAGYLSAIAKSPQGETMPVYPEPGENGAVVPGQGYLVPVNGKIWKRLPFKPVSLLLAFSRERPPAEKEPALSLQRPGGTPDDGKSRSAPDVLTETIDQAVYVVTPRPDPHATVQIEIPLVSP